MAFRFFEAYGEITLRDKGMKSGLKDLKKSLKDIQSIGSKQLTRTFAKLASIVGFTKMTLDTAAFGRSMSILSDKVGIATSSLVNMRTAFNKLNGTGDEAVKLVERLGKGIAGFQFGDKTLSKLGSLMGISGRTSSGKMKTGIDLMYEMADYAKRRVSSVQPNRRDEERRKLMWMFEKEFGISSGFASEMMKGSGYLRSVVSKSDVHQFTNEEIAQQDRLSKSLSNLKENFSTLANVIITNLSPYIIKFVDAMAKLVASFTKHGEVAAVCAALIGLFTSLQGLKWMIGIGSLLNSLGKGALLKALVGGAVTKSAATAATGAATAGTAAATGGIGAAILGTLVNPATILTGIVMGGLNAYAWGKVWLQDTVKDKAYWDKFEKKQYEDMVYHGVGEQYARIESKKLADLGRKWNGLLKDENIKLDNQEIIETNEPLLREDDYLEPELPPLEKSLTDSAIINQFSVNTEVMLNNDGSSSARTNINGTSHNGSSVRGISYAQLASQGGSV